MKPNHNKNQQINERLQQNNQQLSQQQNQSVQANQQNAYSRQTIPGLQAIRPSLMNTIHHAINPVMLPRDARNG